MATVHVTVNDAYIRNPVIGSQPLDVATAVNADGLVAGVVGVKDKIWQVTVTGGNIWVAFGSGPAVGNGAGHLVLDGQTREFICATDGEEIAIKDA